MSNRNDVVTARGIVIEALPNAHFRVEIASPAEALAKAGVGKRPDGSTDELSAASAQGSGEPRPEVVMAYLSGKMRLHRIRVMVGDTVEMVLDPYGGKPRIVRRM